MAVVRILGIDPGTRVVGFGCLEITIGVPARPSQTSPLAMRGSNVVSAAASSGSDLRFVEAGVLRLGGRDAELDRRLLSLAEQFRALVDRLRPTQVALEEAFAGKSAQAALRIGEARGVVIAESARTGLPVRQFAPARVKRCVTGNGAASKETVAAMVDQLVLGGRGSVARGLPADASDAVAVALAWVEMQRSPLQMLGG
ncbi:MAG: crossover junction endodeoxyribonuclease RuvC [Planctomycetes bacterium]|nr:crossover junction endodeoxyribonuclease RuvC [Planctomycetota bacterium]